MYYSRSSIHYFQSAQPRGTPPTKQRLYEGLCPFLYQNNFPFDLLPFYHRKTVVYNNLRAVLFHRMPLLLSFFLGIPL